MRNGPSQASRNAYFTANPLGSRAVSAEPDSPPTVLNRTIKMLPATQNQKKEEYTSYGSLQTILVTIILSNAEQG